MGEVIYGTSSWSDPGWLGSFYPLGLPKARWLAYYAGFLTTVEADVTWYRVPKRSMVARWAEVLPDDFLLSAKMPRQVVQGGTSRTPDPKVLLRPQAVQETCLAFLEALALLGSKCGPVVLQFPHFAKRAFESLTAFLDVLEPFLERLPREFRYAVEIRNRHWLQEDLLEVLRRNRCALVLADLSTMPRPWDIANKLDVVTTDFTYVRLIGDRKAMDARTKRFDQVAIPRPDRLIPCSQMLSEIQPRVSRAYVYANNHYEGHAPATVASLMRLMGREEQARRLEQASCGPPPDHRPHLPFGPSQE